MYPQPSDRTRYPAMPARRERGAILIVSLIILIALTLLALTAMQNSTLSEKMAGNMRQRSLAFNAAEAGLLAGETLLASTPVLPAFNDSAGYYQPDTMLWKDIDWSDGGAVITAATSLTGVAEQPKFYLEELPAVSGGGSLEAGAAMSTQIYRVTARGVGGADTVAVVLQTTYRR